VRYQSVPYLHALADSARFMARAWARDAACPMAVRAGLVGEVGEVGQVGAVGQVGQLGAPVLAPVARRPADGQLARQ
jgi:hypothetical protein